MRGCLSNDESFAGHPLLLVNRQLLFTEILERNHVLL